jgi:hypothetical protein
VTISSVSLPKVTFHGTSTSPTNWTADRVVCSSATNQIAHADQVVVLMLASAVKITLQIICAASTGSLPPPLLLAYQELKLLTIQFYLM